MIHAYICLNSECTQCVLSNEEKQMMGMLESPKLLYLLSKINVIIDNPQELADPYIILNAKGKISKNMTVKKMMNEGYNALDIVNATGINVHIVYQIMSRERKKNGFNK